MALNLTTDVRFPSRLTGCCIGASSSESSSTPTVVKDVFNPLMSNVNRAQGVANTPFTPYGGELAPGSTPLQTQSYGLIGDIAANNTGDATLNQGIGAVNSLTNGDISKYMNPYTKNVTDATMADLERSRQIAQVADAQKASAAGAFGGSGSGVMAALTNEAAGRTAASTFAGLNQAGYTNAQQTALAQGSALGQLSDEQLNQALQRAGAVNTAGTQQQATQGAQDSAAYQEFLRQQAYPGQQQTLLTQALALLQGSIGNSSNSNSSGFSFSLPLPGK